jgi:hypothetical protein
MEVRESAAGARCSRCGHPPEGATSQTSALTGTEQSARVFWLRVYCRVLIVLMVYVLSTGPMYWAIYEAFNTNGHSFLARLYYPIVLACQLSDTICAWFDWYVGLWVY